MTEILIIEDDPLMLRMYKKAFTFGGFEAEIADNGEEGLKKAKEGQPKLILLDIMMPEMDGLEVLDKLKASSDTKKIPVVVLTNLSEQEHAKTSLSKGAIKYLVKSEYDPEQVIEEVKKVLGQ